VAEALFYLLAAGAVLFGVGVVTARMPLYSVLSLLGTFFCLAGVYLLSGFQFLAVTQLLVYAGAIMVLFLFVVMLLNLGEENAVEIRERALVSGRRLTLSVVAAGLLGLVGILAAGWSTEAFTPHPRTVEDGIDRLEPIAEVLFSRYVLPFEASSILLLATMIAVITLAKRQRAGQGSEDVGAGYPWKAPRTTQGGEVRR